MRGFDMRRAVSCSNCITYIMQEDPYLMLKHQATPLVGNDRYEGLIVDLLDEISRFLQTQMEIHLVKDGRYRLSISCSCVTIDFFTTCGKQATTTILGSFQILQLPLFIHMIIFVNILCSHPNRGLGIKEIDEINIQPQW